MNLINFFLFNKKNTADLAKKRLSFILLMDRKKNKKNFYYLDILKQDIINLIYKYIKVKPEIISFNLYDKEKNLSTLQLNIKIPEVKKI